MGLGIAAGPLGRAVAQRPLRCGCCQPARTIQGACSIRTGMNKSATAEAAAAGIEVTADLGPWGLG